MILTVERSCGSGVGRSSHGYRPGEQYSIIRKYEKDGVEYYKIRIIKCLSNIKSKTRVIRRSTFHFAVGEKQEMLLTLKYGKIDPLKAYSWSKYT